jgi:hypothetical protein
MSWRKSTHCGPSFSCVEVADGVQVRDSADPGSPVLRYSPAAWRAFTAGIRSAADTTQGWTDSTHRSRAPEHAA